jgi:hypothetical protein
MHNDHRNEGKFPPVRGAPNSFKNTRQPRLQNHHLSKAYCKVEDVLSLPDNSLDRLIFNKQHERASAKKSVRLCGEEVPGCGLRAGSFQGVEEGSARAAREPTVRKALNGDVVVVVVVAAAAAHWERRRAPTNLEGPREPDPEPKAAVPAGSAGGERPEQRPKDRRRRVARRGTVRQRGRGAQCYQVTSELLASGTWRRFHSIRYVCVYYNSVICASPQQPAVCQKLVVRRGHMLC